MPGRTEAVQSVEIRARVQGFLQAVEFEEGGWVEKGDLLYQIEPDQYAAAVEAASATLAGRQAELDRSQAQSDRMDRLREREVAAEMEAVDAKAALDLARANVQGARAAIVIQRRLRSPR